MIKVSDMYELASILMDLDEESVSRSFIGNEYEVIELLGVFNECSYIKPDIIQFDSENEGYYTFTVDRVGSEVVYGIVPAVNKNTNKFYGVNGDIFVSTNVPYGFEKDLKSYPHISVDSVTRVSIWDEDADDDECDGNCDDCPFNDDKEDAMSSIYTQRSDNGISQSWIDNNGNYFTRSYYSSNKDSMNSIMREWEAFAKKLK